MAAADSGTRVSPRAPMHTFTVLDWAITESRQKAILNLDTARSGSPPLSEKRRQHMSIFAEAGLEPKDPPESKDPSESLVRS